MSTCTYPITIHTSSNDIIQHYIHSSLCHTRANLAMAMYGTSKLSRYHRNIHVEATLLLLRIRILLSACFKHQYSTTIRYCVYYFFQFEENPHVHVRVHVHVHGVHVHVCGLHVHVHVQAVSELYMYIV